LPFVNYSSAVPGGKMMKDSKDVKYVIIQAGGKGTRMGKYTYNKPKALVSVFGMPMILQALKVFKHSKVIIIADYKYEVMRDYLLTFAKDYKYTLVRSFKTGTCAGLREALKYVPSGEKFLLVWSDLFLPDDFELTIEDGKNYVGLSGTFRCRWSFVDNRFVEEPSMENGVAGFFIFSDKGLISDVPEEGEFVRYLSEKKIKFESFVLSGVREFGTIEEYERLFKEGVSRPFNRILIENDLVKKIPVDEKGKTLWAKEVEWYRFVSERGYKRIPQVLGFEPLTMKRIEGIHPFEHQPSPKILENIIGALEELHNLTETIEADRMSLDKEYFIKTFERLFQVVHLIPHAQKREFTVNGIKVINPLFIKDEIESMLKEIYPEKFMVIHGDPTFSNTLVSVNEEVFFIDPRGYFGYTSIYGDPDYDFAKVYYSVVGNYDMFNRKKFTLKIDEKGVELEIADNGYSKFEREFFELVGNEKIWKIKLLHAIIWLSLTTYAWDDYDMICGAFYNGALKLKEVLKEC